MGAENLLKILITGASRGIGLELARQYAATGDWRVHACCRSPETAADVDRVAREAAGRVAIHRLDVTDGAAIRALAGKLKGEAIDLLVSNAGVSPRGGSNSMSVDERVWIDTLRVNAIAPLKMAEAFLPHVTASRRRIIAAIGSLMGSIDDNRSGGHYAYRSSKAALNMVMKSLSVDLRERGITCVTLHPGWVRTDMGGPAAPLTVEQSVRGLRKVLDEVTPADSGRFLAHDGTEAKW